MIIKNTIFGSLQKKWDTFFKDNALLEQLTRKSSAAFFLKFLGMICGYIFTLLIARNFGATAMGILALTLTILNIGVVIGKLGIDNALLRFVSEYATKKKMEVVKGVYLRSIIIVVVSSSTLSILLYFSSEFLAEYVFGKQYLTIYFQIAAAALVPMVLLRLHSECLRGLQKITQYAFFQQVSLHALGSMLLVTFLFFSNSNSIPVLAYVASTILSSLASFFSWQKNSKMNTIVSKNTISLRKLLSTAFPMLLATSMFLIMNWVDIFMIGIFRTDAEVGVYNVILKLSGLTTLTLFSVNAIVAPKFAEFYGKKDFSALERTVHYSTKFIFWTSLPILFFLLLFPRFILNIFGSEFEMGRLALIIIVIGQFVSSFCGSVGYFLHMTNNQGVFQKIMFTAVCTNIILNVFLIPQYGINGAAFASAVSFFQWNFLAVFYIYKKFGILSIHLPFFHQKR